MLDLQRPDADDWVQRYSYDAANRLHTIAAPPGTFTYTYDAGLNGYAGSSGLVDKIALPNGAYISNSFDGLARLLATEMFTSGSAALDYAGYTYNAANQRTQQARGVTSSICVHLWPITLLHLRGRRNRNCVRSPH